MNYLSIDVGGTFTKYGLIDHSGNFVELSSVAGLVSKIPWFKGLLPTTMTSVARFHG